MYNNQQLTFTAEDIVKDYSAIFGKGPEMNTLKRALRNSTDKLAEDRTEDILRLFVTEVWATDCK